MDMVILMKAYCMPVLIQDFLGRNFVMLLGGMDCGEKFMRFSGLVLRRESGHIRAVYISGDLGMRFTRIA